MIVCTYCGEEVCGEVLPESWTRDYDGDAVCEECTASRLSNRIRALEAERDQARAELARLQTPTTQFCKLCERMARERDEARAHARSVEGSWGIVHDVELQHAIAERDTLRARVAELEIRDELLRSDVTEWVAAEDRQHRHARRWKALAKSVRLTRDGLFGDLTRCQDDLDSARSDAARLREVLRGIERHVAEFAFSPHCPCCNRYTFNGPIAHKPDCALAAALKEGDK